MSQAPLNHHRLPALRQVLALAGGYLACGVISAPLQARDWVVSTDGRDGNAGTAEAPFATLRRAVGAMQPGDVCLLRGGRYKETLVLRQKKGTPHKPFLFKPWPGETVVFDGANSLNADWTHWQDGIFRTKLDEPVRQLFVNDRLMMPARWPNADIHDDSVWDLHGTWRHMGPDSTFGRILDANPVLPRHTPQPWFEESRMEANTASLASTGKSFTGATIVMNIGSWLTWAQTISRHEAGSDEIQFGRDFSKSGPTMDRSAQAFPGDPSFWESKIVKGRQGYYYIEGSLDCLDAPGEWFHDHSAGWLYVKPRDGENPAWETARIKARNRGVDAQDCAQVVVEGLRFFATLARFDNCRQIVLDRCRFDFPSASGIPVGDFKRPEVTRLRSTGSAPSRNVVRNCVFENCNGPAIEMTGVDDLVENCLFHAIDWTCLGTGGEGTLNLSHAVDLTFRRNTLDLAGNSEGIRVGPGSTVEYNLVTRTGLLQHDGSAINVGVACIEGTTLRRNWVHDSSKAGLRFDSANMGSPEVRYGHSGAMTENVVWNTMQVKVKGDRHRIINNTAFDNDRVDLSVLDHALSGGINKATVTTGNLATVISGSFRKTTTPVPGEARNNWTGEVRSQLRDPDHLDFRPKPGADIIGATGSLETGPGGASGKRDIGAYQSTADHYWIPGRLETAASMPVPPTGSNGIPASAELMWREAFGATGYTVYWSSDANEVASADQRSPFHRGRADSRRFTPPDHAAGHLYFWRVDAITPSGPVRGPVWSYQLSE